MAYQFQEQWRRGIEGESVLDQWLGRYYRLRPVSPAQEMEGIDRIGTHHLSGRSLSFQYKTDTVAARTGNAFVETWSIKNRSLGWAKKCSADWIVYWVRGVAVYLFRPSSVRGLLPCWEGQYPVRAVDNGSFLTEGLLVPLSELGKVSIVIPEVAR